MKGNQFKVADLLSNYFATENVNEPDDNFTFHCGNCNLRRRGTTSRLRLSLQGEHTPKYFPVFVKRTYNQGKQSFKDTSCVQADQVIPLLFLNNKGMTKSITI